MSISQALYRGLLRIYPRPFRQEYGAEMQRMFRDRLRHEPAVRVWADVLKDSVTTAPREHWDMLRDDIRYSARVLLRTPGFTLSAVGVLAVAIAAVTTVFTAVNATLLRPLPVDRPDRLIYISESEPARNVDAMGTSYANLVDYQRRSRLLEGVAGFVEGSTTVGGTEDPERVNAGFVTWNLFDVLGARPVMGRNFIAAEDRPGLRTAVILSHSLWTRRYGGDPGIIGKRIDVSGSPRTVVGVMPRGFAWPTAAALWVPLALEPDAAVRTNHFISPIARLRDGVSVEQARAELKSIVSAIRREDPEGAGALEIDATDLQTAISRQYGPALVRLLGAVGLVLLIAVANVANLQLARAAARERDTAIRRALGANPSRLMRHFFTENALIGIAACCLGLLLSFVAMHLLIRSAPVDLPFWLDLRPDLRTVAFAAGITAFAALIFGSVPVLHGASTALANSMRMNTSGGGAHSLTGIARSGFVVAQVALSIVLLVGAGLMIRSFVKLQESASALRSRNVLTFSLSLPRTRYPERDDRRVFYEQMRENLASVPGVVSVAATTNMPHGGQWWRAFTSDIERKTSLADTPLVYHSLVTPDYFRTMGIRVLRGRDFGNQDASGAKTAIISESVARRFWPGKDAVGRQLRLDPFNPEEPWRTIVGVVEDIRTAGLREPAPIAVYVPHSQSPASEMTVVVGTTLPPESLLPSLRMRIRGLDPGLPLAQVKTLRRFVSEVTWDFQLYTGLFSAFAVIAVLLAAVGVYGVVAYSVAQRTHEIGVRMAIGADATRVTAMVVREGAAVTALGVLSGLAAALALTRVLETLLFEVRPHDTATFGSVALLLTAVAILASYVPARRAARVDPLLALRAD